MNLSDIEDRLRDALQGMAGEAPPPPSFTADPRPRRNVASSETGRTRRVAVMAAAVALAFAAGWVVLRADTDTARQLQDGSNESASPSVEQRSTSTVPVTASNPTAILQLAPPPVEWTSTNVSVTVAGSMVVALGDGPDGAVAQVFDIASRAWRGASPVPPLPVGALGGSSPGVWTGSQVVYPGASFDPESMTWHVQRGFDPNPNLQRWWALWTGDTVVYLPGGQTYAPATDSWGAIAQVPLNLRGATPVWTGDSVLASDGEAWWQYAPSLEAWTEVAGGPTSATLMQAEMDGTEVVVSTISAIFRYTPSTQTWQRESAAPLGDCVSTSWLLHSNDQLVLASTECGVAERTSSSWRRASDPDGDRPRLACPVLTGTDQLAIIDVCSLTELPVST